ncbi:MAG: hypothetical protein FWF24_07530, partial [Alphaproteobacteria bacterium]|nr:hypothetical protein [Alphaproteobacteria bacterium]
IHYARKRAVKDSANADLWKKAAEIWEVAHHAQAAHEAKTLAPLTSAQQKRKEDIISGFNLGVLYPQHPPQQRRAAGKSLNAA